MQAVSIISVNKTTGFLEPNMGNLKEVFSRIPEEMPISIISIAGAYRTGKSFLLNLLIQYLQSGQTTAAGGGWLKRNVAANEDQPGGFNWRGGDDTCTIGIWMWPQHFVREMNNGQKVAVLLMDTQGLFDGEQDKAQSTFAFALSMLISSCQMYNLKERIQDDHINHLLEFTHFAKLVAGLGLDRPFQHLEFVLRDYPDFDTEQNLVVKSKEYFDKYFTKKVNEEVMKGRLEIKSMFTSMGCTMLPYPGKAVANKKFDGDVKSIDDDFKSGINTLLDKLLTEMLQPKVLDGDCILRNKMLDMIQQYCSMFQQEDFPKPEVMIDVITKQRQVFMKAQALRVMPFSINSAIDTAVRTEEEMEAISKAANDIIDKVFGDALDKASLEEVKEVMKNTYEEGWRRNDRAKPMSRSQKVAIVALVGSIALGGAPVAIVMAPLVAAESAAVAGFTIGSIFGSFFGFSAFHESDKKEREQREKMNKANRQNLSGKDGARRNVLWAAREELKTNWKAVKTLNEMLDPSCKSSEGFFVKTDWKAVKTLNEMLDSLCKSSGGNFVKPERPLKALETVAPNPYGDPKKY